MKRALGLVLFGIAHLMLGAQVTAMPTVSGFTVEQYALVTDPRTMTFAPDGTMYVARDNVGSGGDFGDAVKIHRVSPGGFSVTEYGATALTDPDAILFDGSGTISGVPGSVLVGGGGIGIVAIRPDQSIATIFPISQLGNNDVDALAFDSTGRLVMIAGLDTIRQTTGAVPTVLIGPGSLTSTPAGLAIDGANRIYLTGISGNIDRYDAGGSLLQAGFVTGIGNGPLPNYLGLAFGRGGAFGTDLFVTNNDGDLYRIANDGTPTMFGAGFAKVNDLVGGSFIAFGPDQALYVAEFPNDRILRISAPQSIPEPVTLALLGLGLAGLGLSRARISSATPAI